MGARVSSLATLSVEKELLLKFVGEEHIAPENGQFWDEFLAFKLNTPLTKSESVSLKEAVRHDCRLLVKNNRSTNNFSTLCQILVSNMQKLIRDEVSPANVVETCRRCHRALLVIRICSEYFIENLSDDLVVAQFDSSENNQSVYEQTLLAISQILSFILVDETTYYMHLEVVLLHLVLLSSQLFGAKARHQTDIHKHLLTGECSANAILVVRRLVHNYIKNDIPPTEQGFVGWATSGFLSILGNQSNKSSDTSTLVTLQPLSCQSLLLLLLISFQYVKDANPYKDALVLCRPGKSKNGEDYEKDMECSFTLNFKRLYGALARDLQSDSSVLLLYLLLHGNVAFGKYVLNQNDLECVVGPILQVLYNPENRNPHHMYMALIVILILTQQEEFNEVIHKLPVSDVSWYKEKNLTGISLGSLLILIILRTIQFNMARMRDKYLHTNCLASLANMASNFRFLHTFVTQKFIMLINHLIKRHAKLLERSKCNVGQEEEVADLTVLEEIIHMMLEIINACLYNNVKENSNLIFVLLRNKEVFESFDSHPRFQTVIKNIESILNFFGNIIDSLAPFNNADEIMTLIEEEAGKCPCEELHKLPQLKFKYVEEEASEDFFIPYVWSIILKSSFTQWDISRIKLFCV